MKIVWHMPTLRRTTCGLSIRAIELARRLNEAGHVVTFVVDRDKTDIFEDTVGALRLRRLAVAKRRPVHWGLQARARRAAAVQAVRQIAGEAELAHDLMISCQPEVVAAYAGIAHRGPLLYVCGGTTLLHDEAERTAWSALPIVRRVPYAIDRHLKRRHEAAAFAAADAVVFDSDHTREMVVETYAVAPDRCHTVYGGVDELRFKPPTPDQRRRARQSLGISADGVVVVWTGRFSPEKNLELLLRALPLCRKTPEQVLLVGDGPRREHLVELAAELRLRIAVGTNDLLTRESPPGGAKPPQGGGRMPVVRFTGEQVDVRPFLHAADIFAFPSRGESFGVSLVEAMACGLPCVALRPDNSGIRSASDEIIEHGRTGLLVDEPSPRAFAATLDLLALDGEGRRRCGEAGWARACEHFTWTAGARRLADLISKLVPVPAPSDIQSESRRPGAISLPHSAVGG